MRFREVYFIILSGYFHDELDSCRLDLKPVESFGDFKANTKVIGLKVIKDSNELINQ